MTLQEGLDNFIESRELAGLSEKSIRNYWDFIQKFVDFVGSDTGLDIFSMEHVKPYIRKVVTSGNAKATQGTYIRNMKIFLKWLEKHGNISISACDIRIPKSGKKVLTIYTKEQIKQILQSVKMSENWLTLRNKAMILLMLDSGIRQNEVCTLQRHNLQFEQNRMKVLGKGNKERIVPVGRFSASAVTEYLNTCPYESESVFVDIHGNNLTCDAVKHMMYKVSRKLPFDFSSHKLRHNFATNYCIDQYTKKGMIDIYRLQVLLGHEDVETTKRYMHIAEEFIAAQENISHIDDLFL